MKEEMKWLKILVLALAVTVANTQCVANCVVKPCHETEQSSVPPCHRKAPPAPQTCKYAVAPAEEQVPSSVIASFQHLDFDILVSSQPLVPQRHTEQKAELESSPPAFTAITFSTVIRV